MTSRKRTANDSTPCFGRIIIQLLSLAKDILVAFPFKDENLQQAAEEQSLNIDSAIIEIGSMVSGCEKWEPLRTFLQEAGYHVSPEIDEKMTYFDQISDTIPPADSGMNQ